MLLSAVSVPLAACASTPSGRATIVFPPLAPEESVCARPVELPNSALTQEQVERLWSRDRESLIECGMNLTGTVYLYQDLARTFAEAK